MIKLRILRSKRQGIKVKSEMMDSMKNSIEDYLKNYFVRKIEDVSYNKKIYEAMGYSINVGGKRIRPILMLATYNMYKDSIQEILPIACAIEMIHTYSLIHDDLPCMDNDDLRRGFPTNHKVFGEAIAVLAGDALLNEGLNLLINNSIEKSGEYLAAAKIISEAAGAEGMIGGQLVDILSEGKEISIEQLNYMHKKKTGALISASILAGAILAKAPDEDMKILKEYSEKLGLAFQVKDDILDVVGDEKKLGKPIKSDETNDKTNFITVYGLEKCLQICENLTSECMELLEKLLVNADYLKEITAFLLKRES